MTNEPPSPSPHSYPPGMFRSFVWQALHSVLPPSEEMIRCFQPFQPPSPLFNWSFNRVYLHLWLDVGSEQQTRRFQLQKGVSLGLQKISLTYFIPFSAQNEVSWAKKNHKLSPTNQIWAFTQCCQLCYEWRRSYTQAALGNAFSSGYVQWGVCADVHFKRPRLKLSGSQVATQVFITLFGLYVQNGRPLIRNQVKLDQSQTFIYIALFTGKKIL